MAGTLITVTDAGRAALVAPGSDGTTAHKIVEIGLAGAPFTADKAMKALPGERKRIKTFAGENVAPDTIHVTLKDDTADQFTLYGFGLYLENGVLVAAYGQAAPIMEKSPDALLLLSADMQFATIDAAQLVFGDASFTNPPATTQRQGVIQLATQAEVDVGADDTHAVTPKTAAKRYAALIGADFSGPVKAPALSAEAATLGGATLKNTLRQAVLSVSSFDGLSIEATDAPTATKKPIAIAPWGGNVIVGTTANDGIGLLQVAGLITAQTPPAGDQSRRVATTEFVIAAIASATVGTIVFEARTTARAGFLKLNGAILRRADYPALWAYAQASGAIVAEVIWTANNWGCFSTGDGATTFRIPELRGEFLRCWDDARGADWGRGIGTYQGSQNMYHAHGASSAWIGDHIHSAWTDTQGWHGHGVNDPGHAHTVHGQDPGFGGDVRDSAAMVRGDQGWRRADQVVSGSGTGIWLNGDGNHGHGVGIGGAGGHAHGITVNADGGNEARPRNIAMLAMIRAY